jgi:site-specific recombinase XerD
MANKSLVLVKAPLSRAFTIVTYLTPDEIKQLVAEARKRRNGERNALLILVLFQTGLRISEALSLTMAHIHRFEGKPVLKIIGKGRKPRIIACPDQLEKDLKAYAYTKGLQLNDQIFPINRQRAWQCSSSDLVVQKQ